MMTKSAISFALLRLVAGPFGCLGFSKVSLLRRQLFPSSSSATLFATRPLLPGAAARSSRTFRTSSGNSIRSKSTQSLASTTTSSTETVKKVPGTADMGMAWGDLGFEFRPTNSHIKLVYRENADGSDGSWGEPELVRGEPFVNVHIGATALHYGQACFEGLKAFCHQDGSVHIFRPDENAARMQSSCRRTLMPELPTDLFIKTVEQVVIDNLEYVPPYGSGGALYIRPLLFGSGPRIGLQPADEYTFICLVIPVGDYYAGGLSSPVKCLLIEDYDRAAPRGVGHVKVAGNYAADLLPNRRSKKLGYPIGLYLDAATQSYIEEFSTSNFVGIDNTNNKYITPKSGSVLPSITNKSLMQIAEVQGLTVEARNVPVEELETFDEVLAVGTAVVVTPVGSVTRLRGDGKTKVYEFGQPNEIGATTRRLYDHVRAIQNGEAEDVFGWNYKVQY
jgi:branched-chain amino acid aminotransferase